MSDALEAAKAFAHHVGPKEVHVLTQVHPDDPGVNIRGIFKDRAVAKAVHRNAAETLRRDYEGASHEELGGHTLQVHSVPLHGHAGPLPEKVHVVSSLHPEGGAVVHGAYAERKAAAAHQNEMLRAHWAEHGAALDHEHLPESVWRGEVKAWNREHGTKMDPDYHQFGTQPAFEKHFEETHLAGKRAPYPGPAAANEYFEDAGGEGTDAHHAVYVNSRPVK